MYDMVIHMRDAVPTEAELDEAAKHLTACLMRLCEALEHRDAANYSDVEHRRAAKWGWYTPLAVRHNNINTFYKEWYRRHA